MFFIFELTFFKIISIKNISAQKAEKAMDLTKQEVDKY